MNLAIVIEAEMNLPVVRALSEHTPTLLDVLTLQRDEIIEKLNQYGVVLFRGFSCQDEAYFSKAIELCALGRRCDTSDYKLPRTQLRDGIYTSSDLPGHIALALHHEKPRSEKPPNHIYFCCVTPAEQGGGTLFANAESIWLDIPGSIQDKITKHGVVYRQFLHGSLRRCAWLKNILGRDSAQSLAEYFGTDDKIQIEKNLTQENLQWYWVNKRGDLVLENHLPGVRHHPLTYKASWFNTSSYQNCYENLFFGEQKKLPIYKYLASRYMILNDLFPMVCHYGNGRAFFADEIATINHIIKKHTRVMNWQQGDFMIVDNFTFMHGKEPHQGSRLLYSCMTEC